MNKGSEGKTIRRRVDEIQRTSSERLAEIEAIRDEDIDTSDIPEQIGTQRLYRDENGQLPKRRSLVREVIVITMAERDMTTYALWKAAKEHCPTLTETAVGQFLKGQRSIGLEYLEAIMTALGLEVRKSPASQADSSLPELATPQQAQSSVEAQV